MSSFHQKKLQSYQQQMKELQDKLQKTEQDLGAIILKTLQKKQAFFLDMDTLIGGFFQVIDQINQDDSQIEQWKKIGKNYFKKNSKSSLAEKKRTERIEISFKDN